MEWLKQLQGQLVCLDTAPLIYYIEENSTYLDMVNPFFESLASGNIQVVTSSITLLEVLVRPFRRNEDALATQYRDILVSSEEIRVVPTTEHIAEQAARLRASHNLRTPDAIQMATAIAEGAQFLLTNDSQLPTLPELQVLILDQLS